jgi:hypothetical protein
MNESQYHRFGNPSRVRITWDWYNGGISIDPVDPKAFRMCQFYVRANFRRMGLVNRLANMLLNRPKIAQKSAKFVTRPRILRAPLKVF